MKPGRLLWSLVVVLPVVSGTRPAATAEKAAPVYRVWTLVLDGACEGRPLEVYIQRLADKWGETCGNAPLWNQVSHDVDVSGLSLAGDALSGEVKVILHPDSWTPATAKKRSGSIVLDAKVHGDLIQGAFAGQIDEVAVKGKVSGRTEPFQAASLDMADVELQVENAITYEWEDWRQRIYVDVPRRGGKSLAGRLRTESSIVPDGDIGARVDTTGVEVTADAISGQFMLQVEGRPTITFRVMGRVVGRHVGGTCEVKSGDKTFLRRLRGEIRPTVGK